MDDQKLKDILASITEPAPDEMRKKDSISAAMNAFDEKMQKKSQGSEKTERPIPRSTNLWRRLMKKQYKIAGLTGAVATLAIVAVTGGPMNFRTIYDHGAMTADVTSVNNIAQVQEAPTFAVLSEQKVDPTYSKALGNTSSVRPSISETYGTSAVAGGKSADRLRQEGGLAKGNVAKPQKEMALGRTAPAEIREKKKAEFAAADMAVSAPAPTANRVMTLEESVAVPSTASVQPSFIVPEREDDVQPNQYKDVGRDKFEDFKENPITAVAETPVSTFSVDVDTSSYAFMRRQINNGVLPQKDSVRIEELVNYFDYNYDVPADMETPFKPNVTVYDSPYDMKKKMIHIGIKGHEMQYDEKPASNLVFLLDVSGSMNSQDKLPLVKNAMKMLVEQMNPDDTISIVVYAGAAGTVLQPTKVSEKHKIIQSLERLSAGGSTAGAEGIRQAYALAESNFRKDGINRVILATDGDFNVGIRNHEELQDFVERKRETGIFLSVLGFGQGNYNDHMMQVLAQNGNGVAAYIDSLAEARKVLVEEASANLYPIAKDVKIQVEFNPAFVSEYRLIGYETRHLEREDFNNDAVDAAEIGAGHTVTAIYEITPVGVKPAVDPLRYGAADTSEKKKVRIAPANPSDHEYAFLKMRYKPIDSDKSNLITYPITMEDEVSLENLKPDLKFAAAVTGFAQILRGGKYIGDFDYDDVIALAQQGRGEDLFGYRAEFMNLVRLAKSAAAMRAH